MCVCVLIMGGSSVHTGFSVSFSVSAMAVCVSVSLSIVTSVAFVMAQLDVNRL